MAVYQPAFYPPAASLGNRFAGGLYSAGLGNLANIGYRFGDLIDRFVWFIYFYYETIEVRYWLFILLFFIQYTRKKIIYLFIYLK